MPTPDDPRETTSPDPGPPKTNTDEATIQQEDEAQDAQTREQALDEALKQDAVPFQKASNEHRT